jgi:hypothetical protein
MTASSPSPSKFTHLINSFVGTVLLNNVGISQSVLLKAYHSKLNHLILAVLTSAPFLTWEHYYY